GGHGDNRIPRSERHDPVSQPVDPAAELMAEDDRRTARELVAKDVDVGPADPGRGDRDPDLSGPRLGNGDVTEFDVPRSRTQLHDGFHGAVLLDANPHVPVAGST